MTRVNVTGWRPGIKTISLMKLLRDGSQTDRGLAEAKALVDGLLSGRSFTLTYPTRDEAEQFTQVASDLGAITTLLE